MLVKQVAAGDVGHFGRRLAGEAKAQVVVRHQDTIDGGVLRRLLLQPAQQQRRVAGPQRLQAARVDLRVPGAAQLSRRGRRPVVRRENAVADRFAVAIDGVQPFAVRRKLTPRTCPAASPAACSVWRIAAQTSSHSASILRSLKPGWAAIAAPSRSAIASSSPLARYSPALITVPPTSMPRKTDIAPPICAARS